MAGRRARAYSPRIVVDVTAEDIATAIPQDSGHCMIADAIQRLHPDVTGVSVDLATVRFTDKAKGKRYVYLTPELAQMALLMFDQGELPPPFTFELKRAAQIVPVTTSKARRAKKEASRAAALVNQAAAVLEGKEASGDRPTSRGPAELVPPAGGSRESIPVKVGGKAPAIGALAHTGQAHPKYGRRRTFGLRAAGFSKLGN